MVDVGEILRPGLGQSIILTEVTDFQNFILMDSCVGNAHPKASKSLSILGVRNIKQLLVIPRQWLCWSNARNRM